MDKPLISVILPVYNVEKYLSECMTSLFDQTYENLEFVMVDDGSTNKECSKMCDEFLKRINAWLFFIRKTADCQMQEIMASRKQRVNM